MRSISFKTFLSLSALLALSACGTDTLNTPTPTESAPTPVAVQPSAAPTAAPPEADSGAPGVNISEDGVVTGLGNRIAKACVYGYIDYASQELIGSYSVSDGSGIDAGALKCGSYTLLQLDVVDARGVCPSNPFDSGAMGAAGFIKGRAGIKFSKPCPQECKPTFTTRTVVTYTGEGCTKKKVTTEYTLNSCTKEETSKVISTEDVPESSWIAQTPVRENESSWGACEQGAVTARTQSQPLPFPKVDCDGHKSRTFDLVTYEINSCTEQKREKSRTSKTEQEACTATCEVKDICHTENSKWKWYQNHLVEQWQCENVPPGVPGHNPNHFNTNGHDDFFGACTAAKCYEIRN